jgi:hypothetical protein
MTGWGDRNGAYSDHYKPAGAFLGRPPQFFQVTGKAFKPVPAYGQPRKPNKLEAPEAGL